MTVKKFHKKINRKLFEPFYRSKSQHKGNKGHGLGLAIIKRIMHRHKGQSKSS